MKKKLFSRQRIHLMKCDTFDEAERERGRFMSLVGDEPGRFIIRRMSGHFAVMERRVVGKEE